MKTLTILGRIIYNKKSASNLITDLNKLFDGTMEASVAILEVADRLVKFGFLTWEDVEEAEIKAFSCQ